MYLWFMNWVRHGDSTTFVHVSSTTWFQTSSYWRAKVEFNSINWVRHGSSTKFETGLSVPPHRRLNPINAQALALAFLKRSKIGKKIWFLDQLRKSSVRRLNLRWHWESMTLLTWIREKELEREIKNKGDQFRWKKYKKNNSGDTMRKW